jgi:hypothetical protein
VRRALGAFLLAALAGCTITTEWRGDARFVAESVEAEPPNWTPGETHMTEVVEVLGPPDDVRRLGDELAFFYRFRYAKNREFRLVVYGAQIFRYFLGDDFDSVVIITFDADDRLAHHGQAKFSADGDLVSVLLD